MIGIKSLKQGVGKGFTLVELLVVTGICMLLLAITIPAIQYVRHAASKVECSNRMRNLGVATHHYHTDYRRLPPGCSYEDGKSPYPFMSWLTRLLPYIELDSYWSIAIEDYKKNKVFYTGSHRLLGTPVSAFLCPLEDRRVHESAPTAAITSYVGVTGLSHKTNDGLLYLDSKVKFASIRDGLSNTILIGERPASSRLDLGWWYAGWGQNKDGSGEMHLGVREVYDSKYYISSCPPGPYRFQRGNPASECSVFHFWSYHPGGANYVMADCSVRFFKYEGDPILPALSTRGGAEPVVLDE